MSISPRLMYIVCTSQLFEGVLLGRGKVGIRLDPHQGAGQAAGSLS
jgi:hypothetical protein